VTLCFLGLALIVAAAFTSAVFGVRSTFSTRAQAVLLAAGCVVAAIPAVQVLGGGALATVTLAIPAPGGPWVFGLDALSAAFLLVVLGPGLASALYGTRALFDETPANGRAATVACTLFIMEVAALALVVLARAVVPFLVAWEVMAVLAYFLVTFESDRAEVQRAGLIYLVATHAGTLALLALFAYWVGGAGGALTFEALATAAPRLAAGGALVWGLALFGFGIKAGLVPLHFWLPDAHASSPTHVSALMSGVVIKMGIYGLVRVVALFAAGTAAPPIWWGWLVLILGVLSGVLGVLWALAQHDIKRLLAYHSVENIGIILIGLGIGALGSAYGVPVVAVLGYAGAVLHTVNHAVFKSLLFLGAGAAAHGAGTRIMDRLGGLGRRMPVTWIAFLIGSVAIVGLPPLNGFVSEWVVYQGLLHGVTAAGAIRLALFAVPGLALIGGLALACFVKVCGIVFLGVPRSAGVAQAHEAPAGLLGPMLALALVCVLLGVFPAIAVRPGLALGASLLPAPEPVVERQLLAAVSSIGWLSAAVVVLLVIGSAMWAVFRRRRPLAEAETWGCGYALPSARMQYTASSFAAPLLASWGRLAGIRREASPGAFRGHPREPVLEGAILPAWEGLRATLARLRTIQHGRLWVYLLYLIAVLLVLLAYLAKSAAP
jgi:hydrogenase-4 component B